MRRLFMFLVCICVLAACSPLYYSGGQTARTYSLSTSQDSASIRNLVDAVLHSELQQWIDIREWTEQTIVEETFSSPDSTGSQHVVKRSTTTLSKHSETSTESAQARDEKYQEQIDSVHTKSSVSYIEKHEEKKVMAKADGPIPWYVWVVLLVGAMITGLWLSRHKGWMHLKGR